MENYSNMATSSPATNLGHIYNNSQIDLIDFHISSTETSNKEAYTTRMIILIAFPVILVVGTIGNLLTFIVMQRESLRKSSTCFYMAILAIGDTCK